MSSLLRSRLVRSHSRFVRQPCVRGSACVHASCVRVSFVHASCVLCIRISHCAFALPFTLLAFTLLEFTHHARFLRSGFLHSRVRAFFAFTRVFALLVTRSHVARSVSLCFGFGRPRILRSRFLRFRLRSLLVLQRFVSSRFLRSLFLRPACPHSRSRASRPCVRTSFVSACVHASCVYACVGTSCVGSLFTRRAFVCLRFVRSPSTKPPAAQLQKKMTCMHFLLQKRKRAPLCSSGGVHSA